jgi:hypothetical protein
MKNQRFAKTLTGLSLLASLGVSTQAASYNASLTGGYTAAGLVNQLIPVASGINVVPGSEFFNGSAAANTGFNTSLIIAGAGGTQVGTFAGGDAGPAAPNTGALGIPFSSGVVISTGFLASTATPNDSDLKSGNLSNTGSSLLEVGSGVINGPNLPVGTTRDAGVLQFNFTVANAGIFSFQYAFASDEYSEFVPGNQANDAFAFILKDLTAGTAINLATIGGSTPITVKTVNNGYTLPDPPFTVTPPTNPQYYTDNTLGSNDYQLEFDGIAGGSGNLPLFAQGGVVPGHNYQLVLDIADGGSDQRGDSAVYINPNSVTILPPPPPTVPEPSTYVGALALAGLVVRRLRRKA